MKALKLLAKGMLTLVILMMLVIVVRSFMDARADYDVSLEGTAVPAYTAMDIPYEQTNNFSTAHPFAASAIIDIDGDGTEEMFLGGGPDQPDALLRFSENKFAQIEGVGGIAKKNGIASFGASVIDTDKDGKDDLLVTRTDGVWLHRNLGGTFSSQKLPLAIPDDTTPMSVAVADLNRDGHFDLYVAGYVRLDLVEGQNIFNKEGYGGSSHLFMNNGDNTFRDVTQEAGLTYKHNAFMGIFIDIDKDLDEDLVVAHDTGQVRTWKNLGNGKFVNQPNPNSDEYSYPMGIGVGDINESSSTS